MILLVVESPTKAKAIGEYLKGEKEKYKVLSTYGHIRNLVTKSGSIETENNYEYHWKPTTQWEKHKTEVLASAREADKIIIATDLDREGEGIAWHLLEMLKKAKINKPTERIVFHSVEKSAILEALKQGSELREGLVESYLARIGLDYLFGFSISPLLWRKVPCCKSAGRVQSVALRLIVEREDEIQNFDSKKYFTVHAKYAESTQEAIMMAFDEQEFENGNIFEGSLFDQLVNKKIDLNKLGGTFTVNSIKTQQIKQKPQPPFITSTMLQAASSRLNFSPAMTTQLAQKLYEGFKINGKHMGLITYMRTDSTSIEPSAINNIRKTIEKQFGVNYLPSKPRIYKASAKAQEAHEAIRPVDITLHPSQLDLGDANLEKLYKLIWERTMVSQMEDALLETKTAKIDGKHEKHKSLFELKSSTLLFKGFKALMFDEDEEIEPSVDFSKIKEGAVLNAQEIFEKEHQTQPPRRFSEASLIQQLEKRGIGRPSTYPKIIQVLYEREYAVREKKIIIPTQKGWVVTAFLKSFFPYEVAYEFTAKLEDALDNLNETKGNHISILEKFWQHLSKQIEATKDQSPQIVSEKVQEQFAKYFLKENNKCEKCGSKLVLKIGRFGAIVGCSNYPDCKNIINLDQGPQAAATTTESNFETATGQKIEQKSGPYGPYIEFTENEKPKRIPVPKIWQNQDEGLSNEQAQFLASLPLELGEYNGYKVSIAIGKFGPYIKHNGTFVSIKDPTTIDLEKAQELIEAKNKKASDPAKKKPTFTKKIVKKTK